uniref:Uncharacterized protein n=1 Tax=Nelumbo nucifera TaxID=4432 RepID=A0A822XWZ5_NELNU|nr:TPA_asm: hypothetical protein HUJ06_027622 [Nelumbo nucifera]
MLFIKIFHSLPFVFFPRFISFSINSFWQTMELEKMSNTFRQEQQ